MVEKGKGVVMVLDSQNLFTDDVCVCKCCWLQVFGGVVLFAAWVRSVVFNVTWIWPIRLRFHKCRVVVASHLEVWLLVSNWPLCLDSGQHTNIISQNPDI